MLNALRRNSRRTRLVRSLYEAVSTQARRPEFFRRFGVADTLDGRFDLLALHAWLVFDRLRASGMDDVAQGLSDAIFVGFDEALRELGAGDMGLGRKIRQMGEAFNGRLKAYEEATDEIELSAAILRNAYRGTPDRRDEALHLARYAIASRDRLAACDLSTGKFDFGRPPQANI